MAESEEQAVVGQQKNQDNNDKLWRNHISPAKVPLKYGNHEIDITDSLICSPAESNLTEVSHALHNKTGSGKKRGC